MHCYDKNNCWPPMGGLRISPAFDTSSWCTSGFVARREDTNKLVMVTAGHCLWLYQGSDETWVHDGHSIGMSREYVYKEGADGDVGIINFSDTTAGLFVPQPPSMNRYMTSSGTPIIEYMDGTLTGSYQSVGFQVCRSGVTSGKDCGQIVKALSSNKSCVYVDLPNELCKTIMKTIELDFDSRGGDSGGPVYSTLTQDVGYGIHVHSDHDTDPVPPGQGGIRRSWYVPLNFQRSTILAYNGPEINWCLDSNC